jgi:hypothetical protein
MGFRFGPDGEVVYVPEEQKVAFREELDALLSEAKESQVLERDTVQTEEGEAPAAAPEPALNLRGSSKIEEEEEEPQTQMAAAFAALRMEQLASDTPPEETKA